MSDSDVTTEAAMTPEQLEQEKIDNQDDKIAASASSAAFFTFAAAMSVMMFVASLVFELYGKAGLVVPDKVATFFLIVTFFAIPFLFGLATQFKLHHRVLVAQRYSSKS